MIISMYYDEREFKDQMITLVFAYAMDLLPPYGGDSNDGLGTFDEIE
jgi:hypothetical protein